ncbi:MAG: 30S ribosome-binding factor RbfA [Proteobacteria bacterium]|nr:30S ribosome-binding factor RbfA [Pseudomonadota bacterium]
MMTVNPKKDYYQYGRETDSYKRPKRVADLIKNEIAMLLLQKVKDPRLVNVAIVSTEVTRDLRKAIIYYSVLGDEEKIKKAGAGLARAKGFMRSHLAKELGMRATPELIFKLDRSMAHQQRMEELFKEINISAESAEKDS